MRTAVPLAVVQQIAARSEPVMACQVALDAAWVAAPLGPRTSLCQALSKGFLWRVLGVQAATQAQAQAVLSPFTPITLPEAALAVASPGAGSEPLCLGTAHILPHFVFREAGGVVGTPVKAVVTPMKATVTPMKGTVTPMKAPMTPGSTGGRQCWARVGAGRRGL